MKTNIRLARHTLPALAALLLMVGPLPLPAETAPAPATPSFTTWATNSTPLASGATIDCELRATAAPNSRATSQTLVFIAARHPGGSRNVSIRTGKSKTAAQLALSLAGAFARWTTGATGELLKVGDVLHGGELRLRGDAEGHLVFLFLQPGGFADEIAFDADEIRAFQALVAEALAGTTPAL